MSTVTSPTGATRLKELSIHSPHYGNAKRAIKPVLRDPDSPTKQIRSALKFSPQKTGGKEAFKDSNEDMRLSTIKGFGAARTVSFDVDN